MKHVFVGRNADEQGNITEYRVIRVEKLDGEPIGKVLELDELALKEFLKTHRVDGIKLKKDELLYTQGKIENYPLVKNREVFNDFLIVIAEVYYLNNIIAYQVTDCYGNVTHITREYAVEGAEKQGFPIANGQIVEINNTKLLKPLHGNYAKITWLKEKREKMVLSERALKVSTQEDSPDRIYYRIHTGYGYIFGRFENEKCFSIKCVEVERRYRNKGIGSQLYQALEKYIIANTGVQEFEVSDVVDASSILFWKSQGFSILEYLDQKEEYPEIVRMIKKVRNK